MFSIVLLFLLIFFIGIGSSYYYRDLLQIHNIYTFSVFSMIFGLLILNFFVLTIGHWGIKITGRNLNLIIFILIFCSFIQFIYLAIGIGNLKINLKVIFKLFKCTIDFTDLVFIIIFSSFFIYIYLINIKYYFPSWDHFTYWLLDAKMIYKTGYLRDAQLQENLFNLFNRSSYYPLHAVYIYHFLGDIKEQFSSLFTIIYAFFGTFLTYIFCKKYNSFSKLFVIGILLVINCNFLFTNLILTFYAELIVAFHVVFFFYILFKVFKPDQYVKRIFLLIINLLAIGLIKDGYSSYSFLFAMMWFIFDFKFLISNFKIISLNFYYLFFLVFLFIVIFSREHYINNCINIKGLKIDNSELNAHHSFIDFYNYIFRIKTYLIENYFSVVLIIFMGFFLHIIEFQKQKWQIYLRIIVFLLLSIPIFYYIRSLQSLQSHSLLRYLTLPFYLIPWLFISFQNGTVYSKIKYYFVIILLILLVTFSSLIIFNNYPLNNRPIITGRYAEFRWQKEYCDLGLKVDALIGNKKIMIIDAMSEDIVGNMGIPAIYVRYYLAYNYVGGQCGFPVTSISSIIEKVKPQFILINANQFNNYLLKYFKISEQNKANLIEIIRSKPIEFRTNIIE